MIEAHPLCWPNGWPRTTNQKPSRFDVSFAQARDGLLEQIRLLGGRLPILSTNVPLRRDGLPYANVAEPIDRGAAAYFEMKGKPLVFACDRWDRVKDNIRALEKTIEAIRGIERWGASDMLERAFSGFTALPSPDAHRSWREVLDFLPSDNSQISPQVIEARYRRLAKTRHPDAPTGSHEKMSELNRARDEALREIG